MGAQYIPNSQSFEPIGTIKMMIIPTTASIPSGWLWCDGSSKSTAAYPALFALWGYKFGGAGANFLLPNMRNNFPVGTNGTNAGWLMTSIAGSWQVSGGGAPGNVIYNTTTVDNNLDASTIDVVNDVYDNGANPQIPPYVAVTFIVKAA